MRATFLRSGRFALAVMVLSLGSAVHAAPNLLEDQNSSIVVDPVVQTAISSWKVEGVEHLNEISNWYRVGSTGPERFCGNNSPMSLVSASVFDTNPSVDPRPDSLTAFYTHPQFDLRMDYGVVGFAPGSGTSRMGETISITNTGSAPLNIHFFEYQDLDLTNTANDDSVVQNTAASGVQSDTSGTTVTAYIINCDRYELASYPTTLTKLQNTGPDNLAYSPGFGAPFGPGDVTWSLQWDFVSTNPVRPAIQPGQTVVINKLWELQMNVPEPAGIAIVATILPFLRRRA